MASIRVPLRPAAVALSFSGAAWAVAVPLDPSIFDDDIAGVVDRTASWQLIHLLVAAGAAAAVLGVAGVVAAHGERSEPYAPAIVWTTSVGAVATAGVMLTEALVFPVLADQAPDLLELDGPILGSVGVRALAVVAAAYPVGLVITGILVARADIAPAAGRSLAASTTAFIVFGGPFVPVLGVASTWWVTISHAWLAVVLWRLAPGTARPDTPMSLRRRARPATVGPV